MKQTKILWVDDEIEMLKPHILFLEQKGYEVRALNNGMDAIDLIAVERFDIVFLDENMPGLSGIETLEKIKINHPQLPVVMITKSEEESIMEDAIGSNIADYLIKPVKPNQILLSLKKNLDTKKLVSEKTISSYQQEFRNISMELSENLNHQDWIRIYKNLVHWELSLDSSEDESMLEILMQQKEEANAMFGKYISRNYLDWQKEGNTDIPIMSNRLLKEKVLPSIEKEKPLFLFLIDNLRYDQWKSIEPLLEPYFYNEKEELYYSILPTATQYARNSLFAGMMPLDIQKRLPHLWVDENKTPGKNNYEEDLLADLLSRYKRETSLSYHKVLNMDFAKRLLDKFPNLLNKQLNVIVYNFVDMLSHARTDIEIIRELAEDESAYRSLTRSWFEHSPLFDMLKYLSEKGVNVMITTDHGSIRVKNPVQIVGDKATSSNLRYKTGKSLAYKPKEVFEIRNPHEINLPKQEISSSFIFARQTDFFAYKNNYNHYAAHYKNSFQHGGISLEEMLIPFVFLKAR
ncbi:MAG: PglZ domain-containing protein [Bacteroidales bacterium]|nr:PglZ domain-containing protein [Bacteroidales bacterium]